MTQRAAQPAPKWCAQAVDWLPLGLRRWICRHSRKVQTRI
jgi:hypothetical protein